MKKELEDSLRHMQSHPTTGEPHNRQVISTQVETIFMLDGLKEEIVKLNKNLELSDKQSKKLEISNYRLQWAMLILTFIATMIVAYPVIVSFINWASPFLQTSLNFKAIPVDLISTIAAILSALIASGTVLLGKKKYEKTFNESIKLHDSMTAVVKYKDGNIKDVRKSQ